MKNLVPYPRLNLSKFYPNYALAWSNILKAVACLSDSIGVSIGMLDLPLLVDSSDRQVAHAMTAGLGTEC